MQNSPDAPERRHLWPLAIIASVAAIGTIAYTKWTASASPTRLEGLVKATLVREVRNSLKLTPEDIEVADFKIVKDDVLGYSTIRKVSGVLIINRQAFRGGQMGTGPSFSPSGRTRFKFTGFASEANEALSIAPQLGRIRKTVHFLSFESLREIDDPIGVHFDLSQDFKEFWLALEKGSDNDLFDLTILCLDRGSWKSNFYFWPDSIWAIQARILRANGRLDDAANLLVANLSRDSYKAPLVASECRPLIRALLEKDLADPRAPKLQAAMTQGGTGPPNPAIQDSWP